MAAFIPVPQLRRVAVSPGPVHHPRGRNSAPPSSRAQPVAGSQPTRAAESQRRLGRSTRGSRRATRTPRPCDDGDTRPRCSPGCAMPSGSRPSYLDSSAIVKLAVTEPQTPALRRYLARRRPLVSSALAPTEVSRALLPFGAPATRRSMDVLTRIDLVRINDRVLSDAGRFSRRICARSTRSTWPRPCCSASHWPATSRTTSDSLRLLAALASPSSRRRRRTQMSRSHPRETKHLRGSRRRRRATVPMPSTKRRRRLVRTAWYCQIPHVTLLMPSEPTSPGSTTWPTGTAIRCHRLLQRAGPDVGIHGHVTGK